MLRWIQHSTMLAVVAIAIGLVYLTLWFSLSYVLKTVNPHFYSSDWTRPTLTSKDDNKDQPSHSIAEVQSGKKDNTVKILCWVLTEQNNLDSKAKAVRDTWAKRCDKFVFFSSKANSSFPTIGLDVPKGRAHLTTKALLAFTYCFKYHGQDFDWFLKADDDTYVIVENLRRMVETHDPDAAVYFGYRFKPFTPQGYMSGGAGYILSRESLKKLVVNGLLGHTCATFWSVEDLDIGRCLHSVGVKAMDSIDQDGKERFHPLSMDAYFGSYALPKWAYTYAYHPLQRHYDCCSNYTISFHYIKPHFMYVLDYLIYRLQH